MKTIFLSCILLLSYSYAANILENKELGIWEINGLITDEPTDQYKHIITEGNEFSFSKQLVNTPTAKVEVYEDQIIVTFTNDNPLQFSNESFSGLRLFDYAAEIDDLPQFTISSFVDAFTALFYEESPTTVEENDGSQLDASRLTVYENELFLNLSGLLIPGIVTDGASEQRIVIGFCPVPEPTTPALILASLSLFGLRRRR